MIQRAAPAKLNLYLRTLGLRSDGFHRLDTVMVALDLADQIEVEAAPSLSLDSDTGLELSEDLAGRAALALRGSLSVPGARIRVHKVIPAGGGLGGGSSDAAATLLALDSFWNLETSFDALMTLSAELGSDVPFFLAGQPCLAQGRGERLHSITAPHLGLHGLLMFPDQPVSTPTAYTWLDDDGLARDAGGADGLNPLIMAMEKGDPQGVLAHVHNSFTIPVRRRIPSVAQALDYASRAGLKGLLCGSGSTVIGLSDDINACTRAAHDAPYPHKVVTLQGHFPGSPKATGLSKFRSLHA